MPKFRKKPVVVEAVQWWPADDARHVPVEGLLDNSPRIHYNANRTMYYVTRGGDRPRHWLSVGKRPGSVPESHRNNAMFSPGAVQLTITSTGETYWREVHDFTVWKVDSERDERGNQIIGGHQLDPNDDLFIDYAVSSGWGPESKVAQIKTLEGTMTVSPGDWVITGVKGEKYPCKPDIFATTYELVD